MTASESCRIELKSLEATQELAERIGQRLVPPQTIALEGTLGTGKTQFVRYLAGGLGADAALVTSPTYVLMQTYVGRCKIHHFDLYRLSSAAEVWDLGIDELYEQPCIILIEWADKFPECLPPDVLRLRLESGDGGQRMAELSATGPQSRQVLEHW